ncbi:uncharacterized protein LOC133180019 [Saccostrea echinata]|uniref:uncharacterized protein LOC133180019 n=1 Tax=Saccostrea echinata TaxID=191078 RepID=UPI002A814114|nr:uncharacterized protein LOC133180019 [Saccostrea echinata]
MFTIFNSHLVGVKNKKVKLLLNKPIYIGMTILDLSKLFMYQFHYGFIKKQYRENAKLLMTDTDSLFYRFEVDDLYKEINQHIDAFDTSREHFLFNEKNKKVVGKMKNETGGVPIIGFVGLRPKMYSFTINDGKESEVKKAKGISKSVVSRNLVYQNYVDCLYKRELERHTMNSIRSENHDLYLKAINKISLSPFDDKRYWLAPYGVEGYSYGH